MAQFMTARSNRWRRGRTALIASHQPLILPAVKQSSGTNSSTRLAKIRTDKPSMDLQLDAHSSLRGRAHRNPFEFSFRFSVLFCLHSRKKRTNTCQRNEKKKQTSGNLIQFQLNSEKIKKKGRASLNPTVT